ncbi:MAG: hypothetical protein U9Q96_00045 [Patescibacteria group bacterium]|nr:hypothetical protein [Patescibacteria group bacterium]
MVQVIPKASAKKESGIKKILPWFSFLLVFIVIFLYLITNNKFNNTEILLGEVRQEISAGQSQRYKDVEQDILTFKAKIDDIAGLLENRKKLSSFFSFLEVFVHPNVYFTSLELDMNNSQAKLGGISNDFVSLGQQILAFEKDRFIEDAELESVKLEGGEIQFFIQIYLPSDKTDEKDSR